jgi:hypothetical protein
MRHDFQAFLDFSSYWPTILYTCYYTRNNPGYEVADLPLTGRPWPQ